MGVGEGNREAKLGREHEAGMRRRRPSGAEGMELPGASASPLTPDRNYLSVFPAISCREK